MTEFPLQWRSDYEIGHQVIDAQHKRLIDLANLLHQAVASGHGADIRAQAFNALLLYTKEHFEAEEHVFADAGCPVLEDHVRGHTSLAAELMALAEDDALGFCTDMDTRLEEWVMTHLMPHMTEDDQAAWAVCHHTTAAA